MSSSNMSPTSPAGQIHSNIRHITSQLLSFSWVGDAPKNITRKLMCNAFDNLLITLVAEAICSKDIVFAHSICVIIFHVLLGVDVR